MEFFHPTYPRVIPARRPPGFQPHTGRWSLRWRRPVPTLIADWYAIQGAQPDSAAAKQFLRRITAAFAGSGGPEAFEVMACPVDEAGQPALIVVAHWTDTSDHAAWSARNEWATWWESEDRLGERFGYWRETVLCPYERHETVYSHNHYRIGFARTPDAELVGMTDNGYFGAARDRIPASAIDELRSPLGAAVVPPKSIDPRGHRLLALTPINTTVVRSGQYWQDSEPDQANDYETGLRPKLDRGMNHLAANSNSGCLYLRRLVNLDDHQRERKETSIYAVFRDLSSPGTVDSPPRHPPSDSRTRARVGHQIRAQPRRRHLA